MPSTSHSAGPTDVPLLSQTIGDNLASTVAAFPDRDALIVRHQGIRWTYTEFAARVDEMARALVAWGFEKGERIGVWSPNNSEWVVLQYATAKIGVILVNINPAYRTHEVRYALEQSGCRGLVAATTFKSSDYVSMVEAVRPQLPDLEMVVYMGNPTFEELLERASEVSVETLREIEASLDASDAINIQYTSGTTGFPKGATLTHTNILNNGYFSGRVCGYSEQDRVCIPVPFYHCFGMVLGNLACTSHGAAIVVPSPSFEAIATLEAVQAERCTSLYGVPTMFIAVLGADEFDKYDVSSLRTGIMAGSPCPIEVMKQCIDVLHMPEVTIAYGMTETSPVSTQTAPDDPVSKRVGTVGKVHPHVEIKIIDPDTGNTVEHGVSGELCTRGYSVMQGYWNDPERTAASIDTDGWMHSGDLATMDGDGYINIVGRIKDMVIRGGENVYPREIEEFLYTHPQIRDVQVIGVPDKRFGEEIMAWVQVDNGTDLTADDVRAYCKGRIAHYKIPRYVQVIEEFPMTVTGKIQKFKLRELAVEQLGLAHHVSETA